MEKKQVKKKQLFVVVHEHRFGNDVHVVRASRCPGKQRVIKKLKIDYEAGRDDEFIDIVRAGEIVEM